MKGDWRKLSNVDLHDLYSSPNKTRTIKSSGIRWPGNMSRMERS